VWWAGVTGAGGSGGTQGVSRSKGENQPWPRPCCGCATPQLLVFSICKEKETRIAQPPPPRGPGVSWEHRGSFCTGGQGQREVASGGETPNPTHLSAPPSHSPPPLRNLLQLQEHPTSAYTSNHVSCGPPPLPVLSPPD